MTQQPTLRQPTEGRTIAVVGDVYRFLATGEDTNGKYALFEAIVPPGSGPPPHVHSREEEGFYILEGEITFTIDGKRLVATAGMFANMPVGVPHSFKNESGRPAKMLITLAPAGLEKMFFEFGVPLAEGATTALPPTKDEIEKLLAIAPKYGIEIKAAEALMEAEGDRLMAFDENLAARIRKALARRKGVEEWKAFGGPYFMLNGHMLVGVWNDSMIVRLGLEQEEEALLEPHVRRLDIKRKPMKGWIVVEPEGIENDEQLKGWIQRAVKFVGKLPAK